ncbi:hypothetical protein L4F92_05895 [Avibacterium sp. 21-595]|uniref:hypothetical protein n=1 Tax=Avibacterium sp. 21-595 TaxID=2911527 RepID=UPI002026AED2|nr:hypothetical protein [Avibacterium sp. 21-595]URL05623.1 hypothetical protein L4F92_05895 [Avibacterium sp. 21-595]
MNGKDLLIAKFVSDIGTLDGIIETGSISRKCSLDTFNENIATSAIITTST